MAVLLAFLFLLELFVFSWATYLHQDPVRLGGLEKPSGVSEKPISAAAPERAASPPEALARGSPVALHTSSVCLPPPPAVPALVRPAGPLREPRLPLPGLLLTAPPRPPRPSLWQPLPCTQRALRCHPFHWLPHILTWFEVGILRGFVPSTCFSWLLGDMGGFSCGQFPYSCQTQIDPLYSF